VQKRLVAIATALILLGVGLLAKQHEAEAAHAHEHSGQIVHAQKLADHHEPDSTAHLHGREDHGHHGACTLLAIAHQPIVHTTAGIAVAVTRITRSLGEVATTEPRASIAAYRLAPKTSPPSA
jgi:hypothetical protein